MKNLDAIATVFNADSPLDNEEVEVLEEQFRLDLILGFQYANSLVRRKEYEKGRTKI